MNIWVFTCAKHSQCYEDLTPFLAWPSLSCPVCNVLHTSEAPDLRPPLPMALCPHPAAQRHPRLLFPPHTKFSPSNSRHSPWGTGTAKGLDHTRDPFPRAAVSEDEQSLAGRDTFTSVKGSTSAAVSDWGSGGQYFVRSVLYICWYLHVHHPSRSPWKCLSVRSSHCRTGPVQLWPSTTPHTQLSALQHNC